MKFVLPGNNYAKKSWWVYGSIIKDAQMIIERVLYGTSIAKLIMMPFHSKTTLKTCVAKIIKQIKFDLFENTSKIF